MWGPLSAIAAEKRAFTNLEREEEKGDEFFIIAQPE